MNMMGNILPFTRLYHVMKKIYRYTAKLGFNALKAHQRLLRFSLILLMTGLAAGSAWAQQSSTPFEQLTQRFEAGSVFEAEFTHHYEDAYTGNTSEKSGQLWIGKKKYKIETPDQLVAVDGEISRVYDNKRNRLIVSEYAPEEDDFAPSRILNGVDSTYTVEQQREIENGYLVQLSSDDPFALFQEVEITLDANGIPQKIFVKDTADNLITTTFTGGTFVERSASMFDLTYPDNAEIIDMRDNTE